ncbi:MAG: hypothetical protein K6T17_04775 [Fimbriimonadales bacterium]|nr:hypothetical protein [Fimbriimonadales bacterium]
MLAKLSLPHFLLPFALNLLFAPPGQKTYPLALRFESGKTIKYHEEISIETQSTHKAQSQAHRQQGSHIITLRVTHVDTEAATMEVSYESVKASAQILSAPPNITADQRKKMEQGFASALKQELSGPPRIQKITARGVATLRYQLSENRYLIIERAAFMGVILPDAPKTLNEPWKFRVTPSSPDGGPILEYTYKIVGAKTLPDERAYRIAYSASFSTTEKEGGMTGTMKLNVHGSVLIGEKSQSLLEGERIITQERTLTHPREGTLRSTQKSIQRFKKL